jgi:glucose-6-phosphate 1-dehydrogenase
MGGSRSCPWRRESDDRGGEIQVTRDLPPQAVVIFGASGDLTKRKLLPAFWNLFVQGLLPEGFAILGYARTEMTDDEFREQARESVKLHGRQPPDGDAWQRFAERISYLPGDFATEGDMKQLEERLRDIDERFGTEGRRIFYSATPPAVYPDIARRVSEVGLNKGAKIVFEKPFGRDLASARELNATIHEVFEESQIFRIDHYLGKETVQNILIFRFANGLFEPVWNRRYIDHVELTVAEDIGIEGRGSFYEQTGAIRDLVVTHLFQVMTFVAMEPPVSFQPDRLRDETVKVLRSVVSCDPERVVRGQYRGYRDEPGVAPDSNVETFAAMRIEIDNWRWAGVSFFLRTGKRLADRCSEITLKFNNVPFNVFGETDLALPRRDHLTIRIQPNEGISLALNAKKPGPGLDMDRITMDFDYEEEFGEPIADAYELLLLEVVEGDHTLFLREDGVDRAWEILQPVLDHPTPVIEYEPGSWGPPEADALIAPHKWHATVDLRDHD